MSDFRFTCSILKSECINFGALRNVIVIVLVGGYQMRFGALFKGGGGGEGGDPKR